VEKVTETVELSRSLLSEQIIRIDVETKDGQVSIFPDYAGSFYGRTYDLHSVRTEGPLSYITGKCHLPVTLTLAPLGDTKRALLSLEPPENGPDPLALDWSVTRYNRSPRAVVLDPEIGSNNLMAGKAVPFTLTVKNEGRSDLCQLEAVSRSKDPTFNGRHFYFGRIKPGECASWKVWFTPDPSTAGSVTDVCFVFDEASGYAPDDLVMRLGIGVPDSPRLGIGYKAFEDGSGNSVGDGDNRIEPREDVDILITVKNTGTATARAVKAVLISNDERVAIIDGEKEIGDVSPEKSAEGRITFSVKPSAKGKPLELNLLVQGAGGHANVMEKLTFPIGKAAEPGATLIGTRFWSINDRTVLRKTPGTLARKVYEVPKGTPFKGLRHVYDFYLVRVEAGGRIVEGWVAENQVSDRAPRSETVQAIKIIREKANAPPVITVVSPAGGSTTEEEEVTLIAVITDSDGISSFDVLVDGRNAPEGERDLAIVPPKKPADYPVTQIRLNRTVKLSMGTHELNIVARDASGLESRQSIRIERVLPCGKTHVLAFGISDYENNRNGLRDLNFGSTDAERFVSCLEDIWHPGAGDCTSFLNVRADRETVIDELSYRLPERVGPDDVVFIYFSGHGAPDRRRSPPRKYLLPYDTDPIRLASTAVRLSEIEEALNGIDARSVFLFLDTCYSGAAYARTLEIAGMRAGEIEMEDEDLERLAAGKGRFLFTACTGGEPAYEDQDLKGGLFTTCLLRGLEGRADRDNNGKVTVREMELYLKDEVPALARKKSRTPQTPQVFVYAESDYDTVLARVSPVDKN